MLQHSKAITHIESWIFSTWIKEFRSGVGNPWHACRTGTRALLASTWARPRKRDPPPFKLSISSFSFVKNPSFNLNLMCFSCHMATNRAVSAALHTSQLGGPRWHRSSKFRPRTTNFGWHVEEFCHWFSRFWQAIRKRLPAPGLDCLHNRWNTYSLHHNVNGKCFLKKILWMTLY